jgi:hypothetical protein
MSEQAKAGVQPGVPDLLSGEAPLRLLRDAVKGLGWLLGRTVELLRGRQPLERGALNPGKEMDGVQAGAFQPRQGDLLTPPIPH